MKKFYPLVLCFLCILGTTSFCNAAPLDIGSGSAGKDAPARVQIPLPLEISNVALGMNKAAFGIARPKAKPFQIAATNSANIYSEIIGNSDYFELGLFSFTQDKLSLIRLAGKVKASERKRISLDFLNKLFEMYGKPDTIAALDSLASPTKQAVVFWNKKPYWIMAYASPQEAGVQSRYVPIELKIGKTESFVTLLPDANVIKADERLKILKPVRDAIMASFDEIPVPEVRLPEDLRKTVDRGANQPLSIASSDSNFKWMPRPPFKIVMTSQRTSGPAEATERKAYFQAVREGKENHSEKAPISSKLVAVDDKGAFFNLMALPDFYDTPAYSPTRDWLAISTSEGAFVLELKTGRMGRINDGTRISRTMPAWNSTGKRLAASGTHTPSNSSMLRELGFTDIGDDDIWVHDVPDELGIIVTADAWCVARFSGRDILPVWSKDDKFLYFAHQETPDKNENVFPRKYDYAAANWSIYRVRASNRWQSKDSQKPEKIVGGLPTPQRLSLFPDGKRILVSYAATDYQFMTPQERDAPVPLDVIDLAARTRRPIALVKKTLRDPQFPNRPLQLREATIDPQSGTQLLFSSLAWSGKAEDTAAVCIYMVNIDGTGLKRLTPPKEVTMQSWKYPQLGVTAANAWEKLRPRPNNGTPWTKEDQRKFDAKLEDYQNDLVKKAREIDAAREAELLRKDNERKAREEAAKNAPPAPLPAAP